jgi:hypothetical protein
MRILFMTISLLAACGPGAVGGDLEEVGAADMADPVIGRACGGAAGDTCPKCKYFCGVGGKCELSDIVPSNCDGGL